MCFWVFLWILAWPAFSPAWAQGHPCETEEPTQACREFCAANPQDDRCKEYCDRWPTDSFCATTIDCRDYPETSRESNYCNYNHQQSTRCQIYCECHPESCQNPPLPEDCSEFPRTDGDDRMCHEHPNFMASSGTCREYCHCNRETCDHPIPPDCSQYPENPALNSECSVSSSSQCSLYCECHREECNNPGPPEDCSPFPRSEYRDHWCHEERSASYCQSYCYCHAAACENPPPVDCSAHPENSRSSHVCNTASQASSLNCRFYCGCHPESCANPPPPEDCSLFPRSDVEDRHCHQNPNTYLSEGNGTCSEYCYCNPQGCANPPQPPDCTLYPHDETGDKDIACSALPDYGDCPQYCTCNPERCRPEGPPERPPSVPYCEKFPWDLACFCPGRLHLAECKAYCHLHPLRCERGNYIELPVGDWILPFCELYPRACNPLFSNPFNLCPRPQDNPDCLLLLKEYWQKGWQPPTIPKKKTPLKQKKSFKKQKTLPKRPTIKKWKIL